MLMVLYKNLGGIDMARINYFNIDYNSYSNSNYFNYNSDTINTNNYSGINLSDYASIKNGSYGKLLKSYYAKQERNTTVESKEESAKMTSAKSNADELKKSAYALTKSSLWDENHDRDNILKSIKAFVSDYNELVEDTAKSDSKAVLRNGVWMTNMTSKNAGLLKEVGINIGKGNKLEVDETALKEANISTLKTLFTGYHSYANKVSQKASAISAATVNKNVKSNVSYTQTGSYAKSLSDLLPSEVDEGI